MSKLIFSLIILSLFTQTAFSQFFDEHLSIDSLHAELRKSKNDTIRVSLLLDLSNQYLIRPGEKPSDLDSALLLVKTAQALSGKLGYQKGAGLALLINGRVMREKGKPELAKPMIAHAMKIFEVAGFRSLAAEGHLLQGQGYSNDAPDLDLKISEYLKAVLLFRKVKAVEREAATLKDLGDFYLYKGDTGNAAENLHASLALFESVHYKYMQGIYNLMGRLYRKINNYKLAVKYGLLAVDAGERVNDQTLQMGALYNHLGLTYFDLNKYDLAEKCFEKALKNAVNNNDTYTVQTLAGNLADALTRQNKRQQAVNLMKKMIAHFPATDERSKIRVANKFVILYLRINDLPNARIYCNYLLKARQQLSETDNGQNTIYLMILRYFLQAKDYSHAYHYIREYQKYIDKTGSVSLLHRATQQYFWFQADSASGKYISAIDHYHKHKLLSDSVFNADNLNQISRLQAEFESEKKDRDLKAKVQNIALLENKDQLNQSRLQQSELLRNATFGGLLLLAVISVLLFGRYRTKQIANKQLIEQQGEINERNRSLSSMNVRQEKLISEKEWLLKEVHHRVKNNLQIVMSLLNTQCFYMENSAALEAIRESQQRVQTISLIHKKLYQGDHYGAINMLNYIPELVDYLKESFDIRQNIRFKLKIDELLLDVAQAVPIGLILNEAITNCLKYAFPDKAEGLIQVIFIQTANLRLSLTISDNGIGIPENLGKKPNGSLGMSMIQGLSADLDGTCEIEADKGTVIKIEIPYDQEFLNNKDLDALLLC